MALLATAAPAQADYLDHPEARRFIDEFSADQGYNRAELRGLFKRASKLQSVIDAISRPAEKTLTWGQYRNIFLKEKRIAGGVDFWHEHEPLLKRAEAEYGVAAEIIVAIIGVETYYGRYKGKYSALDSLATLAFDYPPRSKFFRRELGEFLHLAREEQLDPTKIMGSYAAAMGMPQFISSSYRAYAVDFDGDGQRDLWRSKADVIGSVANYFARHGWKRNAPVTELVKPEGEAWRKLAGGGLKPKKTADELAAVGFEPNGEGPYTVMDMEIGDGREAWVGHHNFYVITRYNHSHLYAMAVWQLGQEIAKRYQQENR